MGAFYTVKPGDTVASIAWESGLDDWQTIYDHPNNEALRALRKNPNLLHPGDQIFVPAISVKEIDCPTEKKSTFKLQRPTQKLKLALAAVEPEYGDEPGKGQPQPVERKRLANKSFTLDLDGTVMRGSTDGQGKIEVEIPVSARQGRLVIGDHAWDLEIGNLNPLVEETPDNGVSGAAGRLKNLGYFTGDSAEPNADEMAGALRRFQADERLEETGVLDEKTRAALAGVHGL
jgi:N-acetylmuramoyl-L-alanine amidase